MARLDAPPREGRCLIGNVHNERCVAMVADRCGLDYVLSTYPRLTQTIVVDMDAFNRSVAASEAMGIDWMTLNELSEAIPPAYTEFVGRQLMDHLRP